MEYYHLLKLIEGLAWPIVVFIGIIILRKQLPNLFNRFQKISAFGFEINLADTSASELRIKEVDIQGIRDPISVNGLQSNVAALINKINSSKNADFAIIDLGEGENWLLSRLYILVILLFKAKGIKYFVFLTSENESESKYLGWISSKSIIKTISNYDSDMPINFNGVSQDENINFQIQEGIINIENIDNLIISFIGSLQTQTKSSKKGILLKGSGYYEDTEWVSRELFSTLFSESINENFIMEDPYKDNKDHLNAILRQKGKYIAVINAKGVFKRLIDRDVILKKIALKSPLAE